MAGPPRKGNAKLPLLFNVTFASYRFSNHLPRLKSRIYNRLTIFPFAGILVEYYEEMEKDDDEEEE